MRSWIYIVQYICSVHFETDKLISSYKKLSELILTKVISSYTNITCIFQEKYKVLIK